MNYATKAQITQAGLLAEKYKTTTVRFHPQSGQLEVAVSLKRGKGTRHFWFDRNGDQVSK
jgi:hypothetical protein